jgi:hypothetical protein
MSNRPPEDDGTEGQGWSPPGRGIKALFILAGIVGLLLITWRTWGVTP